MYIYRDGGEVMERSRYVSVKEFIDALIGKKIGVSTDFFKNDIIGVLEQVTVDKDETTITGVVIDKWGWIKFSSILKINEVVRREESPDIINKKYPNNIEVNI